jgi:hypothetical protein
MERLIAQWNGTDGGLLGYWLTFLTVEDALGIRPVSRSLLAAVERAEWSAAQWSFVTRTEKALCARSVDEAESALVCLPRAQHIEITASALLALIKRVDRAAQADAAHSTAVWQRLHLNACVSSEQSCLPLRSTPHLSANRRWQQKQLHRPPARALLLLLLHCLGRQGLALQVPTAKASAAAKARASMTARATMRAIATAIARATATAGVALAVTVALLQCFI